ncbi:hypothetical protein LPTSP4_16010 [Leptospira ryugenii]|uniref:Uncharacterized protein n=1 Tax=Leptospira ryugenii TaxID=1917863 RepID=A0A2P2DZM3_9LEPT|nr:hypothetical protein [Leptospira ryugenii]GBF50078.1 hypothetical protein LPTSP4_16010 [Leptospira ryugenii]
MTRQMTEANIQWLNVKLQESKKIFYLLAIAFTVSFCIFSYVIWFYLDLQESAEWIRFLPIGILVMDAIILYLVIFPRVRRFQLDIQGKQKEILRTKIERTERRTYKNSISFHWILKDGESIQVESSQFEAHQAGEELVLHIAPHSKTLLEVAKEDIF